MINIKLLVVLSIIFHMHQQMVIMFIKLMKLFKLIFLVSQITLIKKMELMIYNGITCKYYKILRLNSSYGVQVVVYKIFFLFMLIQKQLNKKMTGLLHQILMVVSHNHNISILLLILVLKYFQKNLSKMLMLGHLVQVVLMLQEVLDLHSKLIIEIQDYLKLVLINHSLNNQKLYKRYLLVYKIDKLMYKRRIRYDDR